MKLKHIIKEVYTDLDVDQLSELCDYMHELIADKEVDTIAMAARRALDDVAGFETASGATVKNFVNKLVNMYKKKYNV